MIEYIIKVIILSVFVVLTYILAPLLALISMPFKDLPWFLIWFGQYDDDMDGTNDPGWRKEHILLPDTAWRKWWNRTRWIWRNPCQYFDKWILGIPVWDNYKIEVDGNRLIGVDIFEEPKDIPIFKPGWIKKTVINYNGRKLFFYRKVFKWPWINRCCDIKLGYAIWDSVKPREKAKLVFTPFSFSKMGG